MNMRTDRAGWRGVVALVRVWLLAAGVALAFAAPAQAAASADQLQVPKGFKIELLTDAVPNARAMALGRFSDGRGVLYVGSKNAGNVYAVELDHGKARAVHKLASDVLGPIGIAYRDGALYVSAISKILRFDAIDDHLQAPPRPVTVVDDLPGPGTHDWKYIAFGPDGKLYVAVGSPCNVCVPDAAHGLILRMKPDGSEREVVARGLRNSVGFDWSPRDHTLWLTDNGRDMLGDDIPSDELNHVERVGANFGFPYCHQGDLPDPEFGVQHACSEFVPPAAKLGAHVASLGMRFYDASQFPPAYRGGIFIAEHGSWNRSSKVGYRVMYLAVDEAGRVTRAEPFVQGFLRIGALGHESVSGRPADVLVLPDGSLLVSDDQGGAIYRVTYAP
ncbi:MAG TPA: PQQ-dependent sugar dehydrogenase [Burkholderiaceae bacterium]|jgi:glucose/arabinose dehydrogenase